MLFVSKHNTTMYHDEAAVFAADDGVHRNIQLPWTPGCYRRDVRSWSSVPDTGTPHSAFPAFRQEQYIRSNQFLSS